MTVLQTGPGGWTLTWTSAPGVVFAVEEAAEPSGSWQNVGTVTAAGSTAQFTVPIPLWPRAFFRVRVAP